MASSCSILLVHLGLCRVLPRREGAGDATGISKLPEKAGWFLFKAAEEAPEDSRGCRLPCTPGEILVSGVAADPVPDSGDMVASVKCPIQPPLHLWVNLLLAPPPEHAGAEMSPESPKSTVMSGAPNPGGRMRAEDTCSSPQGWKEPGRLCLAFSSWLLLQPAWEVFTQERGPCCDLQPNDNREELLDPPEMEVDGARWRLAAELLQVDTFPEVHTGHCRQPSVSPIHAAGKWAKNHFCTARAFSPPSYKQWPHCHPSLGLRGLRAAQASRWGPLATTARESR